MISVIAAIGKNRELGKDNKLLWDIPEDMKRFRTLTSGHPIIMGRKTFESIGRVLPNRLNIVISRNQELGGKNQDNLIYVNSLDQAIEVSYKNIDLNSQFLTPDSNQEVFIIGGGQIFEQALPIVDKLYLTVVDQAFDADVFFPAYEDMFGVIEKEEKGTSNGFAYTFLDLKKS